MRLLALTALFSFLFCAPVQAQDKPPAVVKYRATLETVRYVYGVSPSVARLAPGDILETNTLDAFGNAIQKPGDTLALVKGDNPLTGPFYVEGAEPGDTLAVQFLAMDVTSPQGVGAFAPGFGALNSTFYTPMLNAPIPEHIYVYPLDREAGFGTF